MKSNKIAVTTVVAGLALTLGISSVYAFGDTGSHWGKNTIDKWSNNQVISGYPNGDFGPNDTMTRGQLAVVINKLMKYPDKASIGSVSDVNPGEYYSDPILSLKEYNVMSGIGNNQMGPNLSITRAEAITLLCKTFGYEPVNGETTFTDNNSIPAWAKGYVKQAQNQGFISGDLLGRVNANSYLTRAEAIAIVNNMIKGYYNTSTSDDLSGVSGIVLVNSNNVTLQNAGDVRIIVAPGVTSGKIVLENCNAKEITIQGACEVEVTGNSNIGTINLDNRYQTKISLNTDTVVGNLVNNAIDTIISGSGKIENLVSKANGLDISGITIDNISIAEGITGTMVDGIEYEYPGIPVDVVIPTISIDKESSSGVAVKELTVNLSANDNIGVSKICYAISNSNTVEPTSYTEVLGNSIELKFPEIADNGMYYIWSYSVDLAGNKSELKVSGEYIIDNTAPVVNLDKNTSSGSVKDMIVKISATDETEVSKIYYAVSTDNKVAPTNYTEVIGNKVDISFPTMGDNDTYYIWYYAVDSLGNTSNAEVSGTYTIDNTAPVVSLDKNTSNGPVKNMTVKISATDETEVSKIYYAVSTDNQVAPTNYTEVMGNKVDISFPTMGDNDTYYIWYYAVDSLGNTSSSVVSGAYIIDNTKPVVNIDKNTSNGPVKSIDVKIHAEGLNAISKIYYGISNSNTIEPVGYTDIASADITVSFPAVGDNNTYYIWYYAVDVNGNVCDKEVSGVYIIDNTIPEVNISENSSNGPVKEFNTTINATDINGIEKIYYSISDSNTIKPNSFTEVAGNKVDISFPTMGDNNTYYIWYYTVDNAGNISNESITDAFVIDNEAPSVKIDKNTSNGPVNDIDVKITATDNNKVSKVGYAISKDNSNAPVDFTEVNGDSVEISFPTMGDNDTYYVWYYAVDELGNKSNAVVTGAYVIDNTIPTINVDKENSNGTVTGIDVKLSASDVNGISKIYYAVTESNTVEPSNFTEVSDTSVDVTIKPIDAEATYYIWYYTVDNAGNSSVKVAVGPYVIDSKGPVVSLDKNDSGNNGNTMVETIDVNISAVDANNVSKIYYAVSTSNTDKPAVFDSIEGTSKIISFPDAGASNDYYIWYYAEDTLGNKSEAKVSGRYKIYKTPVNSSVITFDSDGYLAFDVTDYLKTPTEKVKVMYSIDGGEEKEAKKYREVPLWDYDFMTEETTFVGGQTYRVSLYVIHENGNRETITENFEFEA